jgi:acyl carrier protein
MDHEEVLAGLRQLIASSVPDLPVEDIGPDSNFQADLGLDSLSTIDLVVKVERDFGLSIPDDAIPVLATVNDLADFVLSARRAVND